MREADHRAIISGEARGFRAIFLRGVFWILSLAFSLLARARLLLYRVGVLKRRKASIPVICVGNLTVGGSGKTPTVVMLARWLEGLGHKVAIVSRGYKAGQDGTNDEAKLLSEELPNALLVSNPDRFAGVEHAAASGATIALLDDGFSHLRLERDFDLLLFDATAPFGFEKMLPAGLLREPMSSSRRADFALVTRASSLREDERAKLQSRLAQLGFDQERIAYADHQPSDLIGVSHEGLMPPLASLTGKGVIALCGIGNPRAFQQTLEALGAEVLMLWAEADHFEYPDEWLKVSFPELFKLGAEAIIVTQKDSVKLRGRVNDAAIPVFELRIQMRIHDEGSEALQSEIIRKIPKLGQTQGQA